MEGINLNQAVEIWNRHRPLYRDHLSDEALSRLCFDGELGSASPEELDHLAHCRECMEKWECMVLVEGLGAAAADPLSDGGIIGVGYLKAAGTALTEPVLLKSNCSRFVLGLNIEPGSPTQGWVSLDVIGDRHRMEGRRIKIRDAKGEVFMDTWIRNGKAAADIMDMDRIDFSMWTIALVEESGSGKDE